jgi:hypothetical protein
LNGCGIRALRRAQGEQAANDVVHARRIELLHLGRDVQDAQQGTVIGA